MFPQGFNARNVEPAGIGASQLPVSPSNGWPVIIKAKEMVPVKDKPNDGMLVLTLMIIEGEYTGTEGVYRLNLFSSSEQASKIAEKQLSALCWVTNKPDARVEEELFNIPFRAVVTAQTGEGRENFTQVKGVLDINGNQPGKSGAPTSAQTQAPAAPPTPPPTPAATGGWQAPTAPPATPAATGGWQAPTAPPAAPPWANKPA